jgi:hypothetical protein
MLLSLFIFSSQFLGCANTLTNCTPAPSGLVSWWDGGRVSGNTAFDLMAAMNHGMMSSSLSVISGKSSPAFNFNGNSSSSTVAIPNTSSLNLTHALTLAVWVNNNVTSVTSASLQTLLSQWGFQNGSAFGQSANWQGVNIAGFPGISSDGVTSWSFFNGFQGGVFDGRYVYFVENNASRSLARFDSQGTFTSASSWQGFSFATFTGNITDGSQTWAAIGGLFGGSFDGRYIYFAGGNSTAPVARYDTQGSFFAQTSWQAIRLSHFSGKMSDGITTWSSIGYLRTSTFDGRYVYFSPQGGTGGPLLAQYDTQAGSFSSQSSWQGVNLTSFSGTLVDGTTSWSSLSGLRFWSGTSAGGSIYFVPDTLGVVVRYNSALNFTSSSAWQGVALSGFAGNATDGQTPWTSFNKFNGAAFDGRFIYLKGALAARYDTFKDFSSSSSWQGLSMSTLPGTGADGTLWSTLFAVGLAFDGRYIYSTNTSATRFDTLQSNYASAAGWQAVTPSNFAGTATDGTPWSSFSGYRGSAFDGRYLYFVPNTSGNILRFDTTGNQASFTLNYSGYFNDGMGTSPTGPLITVNTTSAPVTAYSLAKLTQGTWHHIVATYDGTLLSLYIDGSLTTTQTGGSPLVSSQSPLSIGNLAGGSGFANGLINDVQIYNRALSSGEIQSLYGTFFCR